MKKIISLMLALVLVFSLSTSAFAAESPGDASAIELQNAISKVNFDVQKMTDKELAIYNEVLSAAIKQEKAANPNFNEKEFVQQVNQLLYMMEYGQNRPMTRALIQFSIPNGVVATAVNVGVSLIAGGATSAAIKALVSKYGASVAANMLAKEVTARLLAIGIREVTGIGTVIRTVVKNVLDPGSTVADWLDNHDPNPGNGHVDVAIG